MLTPLYSRERPSVPVEQEGVWAHTTGLEILENLEHLCPCLEINPDL